MTLSLQVPCVRAIPWLLLGLGCSSSSGSGPYPYKPGTTQVIGASSPGASSPGDPSTAIGTSKTGTGSAGSGATSVTPIATYTAVTPASPDACLEVEGKCLKPQKDCLDADATADVIVGPDGTQLAVVCYPNRDYDVISIGDAPVKTAPLGNNTVVVFDDAADGLDVEGDVTISGNNVILWGYGPDTAVIGGNLAIEKNNAIVRGVRINGDVTIDKNNASLIDCVIMGNLTITGNNVNLALCQIWGKLKIEGKNAVFVSNLVAGDQPVAGDNLRCNDNHHFADANADLTFQPGEVTDAISCESRGAPVPNMSGLTPKKP